MDLLGASTAVAVPFINSLESKDDIPLPDPTSIGVIVTPEDQKPYNPEPPDLPELAIKPDVYTAPKLVEGPPPPEIQLGINVDIMAKSVNKPIPPEVVPVDDPPEEIDEPDSEPVLFPEEDARFMNGDINA